MFIVCVLFVRGHSGLISAFCSGRVRDEGYCFRFLAGRMYVFPCVPVLLASHRLLTCFVYLAASLYQQVGLLSAVLVMALRARYWRLPFMVFLFVCGHSFRAVLVLFPEL